MKAIGIDIGTTTISMAVVEKDMDTGSKKLLDSRTILNESHIKTEREWEFLQEPEWITGKIQEALNELLTVYPDTERIGLTGQMHGILYVNKEGKAVSPLYTWQDKRGDIPEFEGKSLVEVLKEKTGLSLASGYGLVTHLFHIKKNQVPLQAASLCTIGDYVGMGLTGRTTPLLHVSSGASLGFFLAEKGEFQKEILEKLGADLSILPQIARGEDILGKYRGIPVTVALGDNQASFYGAVGMEEKNLLLNMGTGGQVSMMSSQYREIPGIETRPYVKGSYILVGASLCGGRAYGILEKFFRSYGAALTGKEEEQYGLMEKLAWEAVGSQERLRVDTSFMGTRENPGVRGSVRNISQDNFTPGHLICGVLEGMARELYNMYGKIRSQTGDADKVTASGNGIRKNKVLQHICREIFQREIELAPCKEEAAWGAALWSMENKP